MERKLICEPHFFPDINQRLTFKIINVTCDSFESPKSTAEEIDFPSYKDNKYVAVEVYGANALIVILRYFVCIMYYLRVIAS